MKRQLVVLGLMLGATCVASAQDSVQDGQTLDHNVAAPFSATSAPAGSLSLALPAATSLPLATTSLTPLPASDAAPGNADPAPSPAPTPKFIYGGRDDFRWQLGIGVDWLRFRSSIFNASAIGFNTSVTYFTNDWFGVEGDFTAGFAPQILDREHVKLLIIGGGPKIAWRERKWEPWAHAIVGFAHEQPQTADNTRHAFAVKVGGGADYRFNPRLSGRLEGNWVRTTFFSQSQNNFELSASVVFHF